MLHPDMGCNMVQITARDATNGEPVKVTIDRGCIAGIEPAGELGRRWVAPALIDLQVNGYKGFDFNDSAPNPEKAAGAIFALREAGVGLCYPTVTTGGFGHLRRALGAVAGACRQDPWVRRAVGGIHLEGPYISPVDGPRGAHPPQHVRPPDWDEFQYLQESAEGMIRLVTLAPELPGAVSMIERLVEQGIVVALGHHAAGAADIDAAVRAGGRFCTHLGNGTHAQIPRHPNYIWEQLGDDRLQASFIVDGHHLPPSVVRCMLRAKGTERSVLVSDAIFLAGMPPGVAEFMGLHVELTPERRVNLVGTPYLAGSALQLCEGVGKAIQFAGLSLGDAVAMATRNPARLMGIDDRWGCLAVGREADLMLFSWDDERGITMETLLARGDVVWGKAIS